ncbi:MAG: 3-phosphoshikimate 1-carboxyvinyltransferase [Oscillospiraceae bacterium]|nr:3-phosphoshikimate 1-carboxyvinyltransferase [Oscillospiraceae bacterium]
MNLKIEPSVLKGKVKIPSSKSYAHRMLICAGLSNGKSVIKGINFSKDIEATISAMKSLGADFEINDNEITVYGIPKYSGTPVKADINCCESGSTLRFIIPVAGAVGADATFYGEGRLPQRPIDIYIRELSAKGITFEYNNTMPFSMKGRLSGGDFYLEGDVSSQFVTGLLFALPMLDGDSKIIMKSKLESKPYADMTIESLKLFGVTVEETDYGYFIKGNQKYKAHNCTVEGDYSQSAFFITANAINSNNNIELENLNPDSVQGDKKIIEIVNTMKENGKNGKLGHFDVDCSDIPDLVPILAVLGSFGTEKSTIFNAKRLKIKESDRLVAISSVLNNIGGKVTALDDGLVIEPVENFIGGEIESFGDHRIVMCGAVASTRSESPVIIKGSEAVSKSYPDFFRDFQNLGGTFNVINLE